MSDKMQSSLLPKQMAVILKTLLSASKNGHFEHRAEVQKRITRGKMAAGVRNLGQGARISA